MNARGSSFVYFIKPVGMDGPIKIGCSIHPQQRLETLAQQSPIPLEVIGMVAGTLEDERFLHRCFALQHSHLEWFKASPALHAAIQSILGAGIQFARDNLIPQCEGRPWFAAHPKRKKYNPQRACQFWVRP